jgi:hypothetical protein
VTWSISGTSNGDPAVVGISIDGGAEEIVALGATADFAFTRTVTVSDYATPTNIRVRLFDDAPAGRGEAVVYGQVDSGDPPPPTVTIYKRAACNSGDADTTNDCIVSGITFPCNDSRCGYLGIQVSGARVSFGCQVIQSAGQPWEQPPRPYHGNIAEGDTDTATDWIFNDGRVGVNCAANGSKGFSVNAYMDWP